MDRRSFLRNVALGSGAVVLGPTFWKQAYAAPAMAGTVYGPLLAPDANGVRLPAGFTSRVVATSNQSVGNTGYVWHPAPDGGACFITDDGGWIYVSNSEIPFAGGVGALRFDRDGTVVGAHRVLAGTSANCAGGPTPWGTWLTCEEHDNGFVYECDPGSINTQARTIRPGLGTFTHEGAAVDPVRRHVYLTEDERDGRFYRFTSENWPDLRVGVLEAATLTKVADFDERDPRWTVTWQRIPHPNIAPGTTPTREQVPGTTAFGGGEGVWYDSGFVYFTTKHDQRVWCLNAVTNVMELVYDDNLMPDAPLTGVDNIVVTKAGEIFVAEDGGDMQICVISPKRKIEPMLQVVGHDGSEITGPAFSPDGRRLYFSSQRGKDAGTTGPFSTGTGVTFEVTGPFHGAAKKPRAWGRPVGTTRPDDVEPAQGVDGFFSQIVRTADKAFRRRGL